MQESTCEFIKPELVSIQLGLPKAQRYLHSGSAQLIMVEDTSTPKSPSHLFSLNGNFLSAVGNSICKNNERIDCKFIDGSTNVGGFSFRYKTI
jgi:hypothetical protein